MKKIYNIIEKDMNFVSQVSYIEHWIPLTSNKKHKFNIFMEFALLTLLFENIVFMTGYFMNKELINFFLFQLLLVLGLLLMQFSKTRKARKNIYQWQNSVVLWSQLYLKYSLNSLIGKLRVLPYLLVSLEKSIRQINKVVIKMRNNCLYELALEKLKGLQNITNNKKRVIKTRIKKNTLSFFLSLNENN